MCRRSRWPRRARRPGRSGRLLHRPFDVVTTEPGQGRAWAQDELRDGQADVAVVTGGDRPVVLIDGSQLFAARAALTALASMQQLARPAGPAGRGRSRAGARRLALGAPQVTILYNPGLKTSDIMIPGPGRASSWCSSA